MCTTVSGLVRSNVACRVRHQLQSCTLMCDREWREGEARVAVVIEVLPGTTRLRRLLAGLCTELGYRCYVPQPGRLQRLQPGRLGEVRLLQEYGVQDIVLSADPGLPLTVAELGPAGRC